MRNGIKKLFFTSLFTIFGLCFNCNYTNGFEIITGTHTANTLYYYSILGLENGESTNGTNREYVNAFNENRFTIENIGNGNRKYTDYQDGEYNNILRLRQYNYGQNARNRIWNIDNEIAFLGGNETDYAGFQGGIKPLKYCLTDEQNIVNDCLLSWNNNDISNLYAMDLNITKIYFGVYSAMQNGGLPATTSENLYCLDDNGTVYCVKCNPGGYNKNSIQQTCQGGQETLYQKTMQTNFQYLSENIVGESPFESAGTTTPQNNYYTCPTIQQLINTYPSQYNTGLCYSSNLIFSNGTITTTTPKSIFELYPYLTGFMRDIDLYNNYCTAPNTTTTCQTAFEGKEEEYTLISKAMDNNINKMKLYQYCNLQLNFEDKNATTCVSTGIYATGVQENITTQDIANALLNEDYQTILPTTTGTVFEEIQGEERQVNWNILESIENIYTKITSIFQGRSGTEGIIPEYITRMILVICLFALFKK